MVTQLNRAADEEACWMLKPTRSMSWKQAKRFILLIAIVSLGIGGFFMARGLPLVLPFSGLEILAVGFAFYLVLRDGERREVVRVSGDSLVIETGAQDVEDRIEFNRFWVRVELEGSRYRYHPSRLVVASRGRKVELGSFLTEGERKTFARTLINALGKNR
jgi:uncharacterized membrane protein